MTAHDWLLLIGGAAFGATFCLLALAVFSLYLRWRRG